MSAASAAAPFDPERRVRSRHVCDSLQSRVVIERVAGPQQLGDDPRPSRPVGGRATSASSAPAGSAGRRRRGAEGTGVWLVHDGPRGRAGRDGADHVLQAVPVAGEHRREAGVSAGADDQVDEWWVDAGAARCAAAAQQVRQARQCLQQRDCGSREAPRATGPATPPRRPEPEPVRHPVRRRRRADRQPLAPDAPSTTRSPARRSSSGPVRAAAAVRGRSGRQGRCCSLPAGPRPSRRRPPSPWPARRPPAPPCAPGRNRAPACVSSTVRPDRSSRSTPSSRSSFAICWLTAGWPMDKDRAALPKCRCSATATKPSSSRSSTRPCCHRGAARKNY